VLFSQTIDAVTVIETVASPRVRLLYDMYHSITEGEDPAAILARHGAHVAHVQVADAPGRGEPGSGTVDWPAMLRLLQAAGYRGPIGVECTPTRASTPDALAFIRDLCAQA
jgi:hydroxypyruvate isomerase